MIARGQQYTMCFDVIKTDGTEDTTTTPTTRTCKDNGNWVATTNSAVRKTRPGGSNSNSFHITLTASEMDANVVGLEVTGSGLVPRVYWLHTEDVWTATKAGYIDQAISAKRAVTLAASDVTGNLPSDLQTIRQRTVADPGGTVAIGTSVAQQDANGRVSANVTAISGDATAAANLETAFDGGQYNVGGGAIVAASVAGSVNSVTNPVTLTSAYDAAKTAAQPGDAMTLTSTERSTLVSAVWSAASRTLTSFGSLVSDIVSGVWSASVRTLTSFGSLSADTATAVWNASSRTLTSFGSLVADIWSATTRTLTSFGTLPQDTASAVWSATTRTLTSFGTLVSDIVSGVWSAAERTLTSFGSLAQDVASGVWSAPSRTLTSFGSLVSDVASAVWSATSRTLTGFGSLVADITAAVWSAATRTLTGFGSLVSDIVSGVWSANTRTLTSFGNLPALIDQTLSASHGSGQWGPSTGMGAYVLTIDVLGSGSPVEGVTVRVSRTGELYITRTNASGRVQVSIDAGTYTIAAVKAGWSHTPQQVVVSGDTTVQVTLDAVTIPPPSDPSLTYGYLYTYNTSGMLQSGVKIEFQLLEKLGVSGRSPTGETFTGVSDASGLMVVPLWKGGRYRARRGQGVWVFFTASQEPVTMLPEILGK